MRGPPDPEEGAVNCRTIVAYVSECQRVRGPPDPEEGVPLNTGHTASLTLFIKGSSGTTGLWERLNPASGGGVRRGRGEREGDVE